MDLQAETAPPRPLPSPSLAPVPLPGRERAQRRALARMRAVATGLLLAMAAVFVLATHYGDLHPALPFVRAFAEAAMIGALADWFAVTALFRHPLGLPIPHTAIVPRNQARIGEGLGAFVADNFLDPDLVAAKVASLDPGGRVLRWLDDPVRRAEIAARVVALVPDLLAALDDEEIADFIERNLAARLRALGLAPLAGEILSLLIAGGHHRALVDEGLAGLRRVLGRHRDLVAEKVRAQSPWWLPRAIDAGIAQRVVAGIDEMLEELADPLSSARARLEDALASLADDLRHDPDVRARGEEWLAQIVANPVVGRYFRDLAAALRARILADVTRPGSAIGRHVEDALAVFARTMAEDDSVRARLDTWLVASARHVAETRRRDIGVWIAGVVARWDARTATDKLELEVGRDLQFIRINGTLVGGLIGLGLHLVSRAIG